MTVIRIVKQLILTLYTSNLTETCRCPEFFSSIWWANPPYTIASKFQHDVNKTSGIFTDIVNNMLKEVCGICIEYKTLRTTLDYTERDHKTVQKSTHYELAASLNERADFAFPIRGSNTSTTHIGRHFYIPLLDVPGVALLTVKDAHDVYSRVMAQSLFSCWPLIVFTISLAMVSGIVVWFLVSISFYLCFLQKLCKYKYWRIPYNLDRCSLANC